MKAEILMLLVRICAISVVAFAPGSSRMALLLGAHYVQSCSKQPSLVQALRFLEVWDVAMLGKRASCPLPQTLPPATSRGV